MQNPSRFRLDLKEILLLIAGTALALGSFKSDDPWVVSPMLFISGCAFVALCYWHHGNPLKRIGVSIFVVAVLCFISWRDLKKPTKIEATERTVAPPRAPIPNRPQMIIQTADHSNCANISAKDAKVKCEIEQEKESRDGKAKP
jgi:hypothetical protein